MLHYTIPDFSGVDDFLCLLAKRQGKLKKGGMPNKDKAARGMLMDWNRSVNIYGYDSTIDHSCYLFCTKLCGYLVLPRAPFLEMLKYCLVRFVNFNTAI